MAYFRTIAAPDLDLKQVFPTPDYSIVAAVDLGTKYSGYAFQINGTKEIFVNTKWNESALSYKAPTCLLLDRNGKCEAFGQEAIVQYTEMEAEEAADYYCFSTFKMFLYDAMKKEKRIDRDTPLKETRGKEYPAIRVFGESLRYLKRHMLTQMEKSVGMTTATNKDILWVLTVPAIWDDVAKDFMREAAYEGELISRDDSDRLIIALEPEVAALYCREVPVSNLASGGDIKEVAPGEQYLVIDAGGGTVDITAHEVLMGGEVKEIIKATGGPHGGEEVDSNFLSLLSDIFSEEFMDSFKQECGPAFHDILQNLETSKRALNFDGKRPLNLGLPHDFLHHFDEIVGETVQGMLDMFQENRGMKISLRRGALTVPLEDVKTLYEPVLQAIKKISLGVMAKPEMANCKTVFLVGGFADCPLLQKAIKKGLEARDKNIRLIIPNGAGLTVLRGAVMFGKAPMMIKERIMQRSYGVPVVLPWDDNRYKNQDKKYEHKGGTFCRDVFYPFVHAGDLVRVGDHKEHVFSPLNSDSTVFVAKICASPNKDVIYSDEPGCQEVGEVTVNLPPMPGLTGERPCGLYFYFGGTEVKVIAMDIQTNTKAETKISFMAKPN